MVSLKHIFEFNQLKSLSNKVKHGIDFNDPQILWEDPFLVELKSRPGTEERFIAIGLIQDLIWTAIYIIRKTNLRLISIRRGRKSERKFYYDINEKKNYKKKL